MRRFFLLAPLALIWAMAGTVPDAAAFSQWSVDADSGNCANCHGNYQASPYISAKDGTDWGTDLMSGHLSFIDTGCSTCHSSGGRFPVLLGSSAGGSGLDPISCVGCHGRVEDLNNGQIGAGLRQHHENAGVASCGGCHQDNNPATFTTVAESVNPPYYGVGSLPTDACSGASAVVPEAQFGPTGLDNDGDLLDDGADPDCAINQPPVANANGPYTGTVGVPVTFDGTGSNDSDGSIVSYDWNFGDGTVALNAGPTPTHTYATDGIFNVTLTVTDDAGATGLDTTTATIGLGGLPPVADPNGPYTGTVGSPVQFDGSGSTDPNGNGTIVAYDWDFGDGNTGTGVAPMNTYGAAGLYNVTLTVTDDTGLIDSAGTTADIAEPGQLDLDIAQFSVTKRVSASRVKPIGIKLVVKNNGTVEGSAMATITGMQNGVMVYSEMLQVTDPIGNGRTRYDDGSVPAISLYTPAEPGDILWTATIADDDPDIDEATAVTRVVQ